MRRLKQMRNMSGVFAQSQWRRCSVGFFQKVQGGSCCGLPRENGQGQDHHDRFFSDFEIIPATGIQSDSRYVGLNLVRDAGPDRPGLRCRAAALTSPRRTRG